MRRALLALALLATVPAALSAQRRAPETRRIRAEYASVLLQSKRYDEAIVEYRRLVAAEPDAPRVSPGIGAGTRVVEAAS